MNIPTEHLAQGLYGIAQDANSHVDGIILISHVHNQDGTVTTMFDTVSHLPRETINEELVGYVAGEFADKLDGK